MSVSFGDTQIPEIAPGFRLQWEEAQGCHVLLYPEGMVKLNASAGEILKCCDGQASVAEIIDALMQRFDNPNIRADVLKFLEVAHDNGWIRTRRSA